MTSPELVELIARSGRLKPTHASAPFSEGCGVGEAVSRSTFEAPSFNVIRTGPANTLAGPPPAAGTEADADAGGSAGGFAAGLPPVDETGGGAVLVTCALSSESEFVAN